MFGLEDETSVGVGRPSFRVILGGSGGIFKVIFGAGGSVTVFLASCTKFLKNAWNWVSPCSHYPLA